LIEHTGKDSNGYLKSMTGNSIYGVELTAAEVFRERTKKKIIPE